jgi:hypothetical protein
MSKFCSDLREKLSNTRISGLIHTAVSVRPNSGRQGPGAHRKYHAQCGMTDLIDISSLYSTSEESDLAYHNVTRR